MYNLKRSDDSDKLYKTAIKIDQIFPKIVTFPVFFRHYKIEG